MKVIKDGKLAKQVTCKYCGCVYEFEGKDVISDFDYATLIVYPKPTKKYVLCPQCNEMHYLSKPVEVE